MKKLIIIAAGLITMHSCTKGGGTTTTATPGTTLNATETSLLGRWLLIKEKYDGYNSDTTYTSTSPAVYIEFQSTPLGATGLPEYYKKAQDARLSIMGAGVGIQASWWFYDQSASRLVIFSGQYEILSQSSTSLVLKRTNLVYTVTQTFKK